MELFKSIYALLRVHRQVTESTECLEDIKNKSSMWNIEHFKSALVVEKENPATFICDIMARDVIECSKLHRMSMQI